MQRFIVLRILQGLLAVFVISIIVFALSRVAGDPLAAILDDEAGKEQIERLRQSWGLDKPIHVQYFTYVRRLLTGDLGVSFRWDRPVLELIAERLPATVQLSSFALVITGLIAFPIGVLSAVKKDSWFDAGGKMFAILGQSAPTFAVGLILMWLFAVQLGWLPTSGRGGFRHMLLPGFALGYYNVAAIMRLTRSSMLDVLDTEYVKLARIKGIPEWKIVWKHCFRNALIGPLTYFSLIFAVLITGSVVIETVFAWPGLGLMVIEAINSKDHIVVQAVVLLFAILYVGINIITDITYAYVDPRIRYG
jgi:peptide/nickel transport system permease protein